MGRLFRTSGASFFQKLLLGYVAVGAFLVLATTGAYYRIVVHSIQSDVKADIANELRLAVEYFNRSFGARLSSDLWFISTSPTIDAYLRSQKNEFLITRPEVESLFIRATLKNRDLWRSIRFVNASGYEAVVVEGNQRIRDLHFVEAPPQDIFGKYLRTLFREAKTSPIELVDGGVREDSVLVSPPFKSSDGQWGFLIGAPRIDPETNAFGGAVIIHCLLKQYLRHVGATRYQDWPMAWVYTLDGTPILSPRQVNVNDRNVFTFSENIRMGSKNREFLKLVFHNAPEVFSEEFKRVSKIAWAVSGATMFIVVVISFLLSRQFSKPLDALGRAADRLAAGDRSFEVSVGGGPEIQRLSGSFNKMIEDLQNTTVSKHYVDNILESMIDSLVVVDTQDRIKIINRATSRLLGYTDLDLIGLPVEILFENKSVLGTLREQASKGQGFVNDVELEYRTQAGQRIPVLFSMTTLYNKEIGKDGTVLIAQDVRERKRLEKLVVQSEKMSAVGQLAAGVAHEINNPLGVILGYMEVVASEMKETDALWEPIEATRREAIRCKNLVQNLLTFSRERKPGFAMEQPETMVEDALALVETQAHVRNIEILRDFPPSLQHVSMDRGQMGQVIINLCTNAMDAMPQGGRLTLRLAQTPHWFEMFVTDTGTGIPPELQQRIFEPFFSTKEIGKGTGLGLSLVFEMVKKHHGEIEVKSEVGKGTTFIVRLPLDVKAEAA